VGSFVSVVIATLVTWLLVPFFISLAPRIGLLDIPDGTTKKHSNPTPYLGGVAIGLGLLVGIWFCSVPMNSLVLKVLLGAYAMLLIGLVDDVYRILYYQKFLAQLIVACWLVYQGVSIELPFLPACFSFAISLLWLLTLMNAFNLVDVMDGLATTIALGCSISLLLLCYGMHCASIACVLMPFIGCLLAFLYYNLPIASIYLGDAGSLFIGSLLGSMGLIIPWNSMVAYGWITPCIIYALPLMEVTSLVAIRSYRKIPFYKASPDHFCLYLRRKEWSIPIILWYTVLINVILFFTALFFLYGWLSLIHIFILAFFYFLVWLFVLIRF